MSPIAIAWRNIVTRPVQSLLTVLIVALGLGLALAVVVLAEGLQRGITEAGGPFELVIGPKGSATQLVVSSVLLQDVPLGNIDYTQYQTLAADPRVKEAVPLALGDNVHGFRMVGTTPAFFRVAITPERPPFYHMAQGFPFDDDGEAVLGSAAARQLNFHVGDTFVSTHGTLGGINEVGHTNFPYHVVGVLAPTNTPADAGIYVSLSSYWKVHAGTHDSIFTPGGVITTTHDLPAPPAVSEHGVTAVLVRAKDISSAYQLYQSINAGSALQAALPGAVLTQFLDYLGQGQRALTLVSLVALVMAGVSMALALYGAVSARRREIAVLRALGASRATIVSVALVEAVLLGLLGCAGGLVIGHTVAAAIGWTVSQRSALAVPQTLSAAELPVLVGVLLLGALAGVLPALRAYRIDPAQELVQY